MLEYHLFTETATKNFSTAIHAEVHVIENTLATSGGADIKPVPVAEFGDYVAQSHSHSDRGFKDQYSVSLKGTK